MIEEIQFLGRKFYNTNTKKESYLIDDLIEEKITIDRSFISSFQNERTTAFKEIMPISPDKIS